MRVIIFVVEGKKKSSFLKYMVLDWTQEGAMVLSNVTVYSGS